ncbi:thioredoxin family protein [Thiomonas sp. FB-Cd]|uniref:thioredoxin family protein n=1 Tax=Thiomonas sp. FB-Cd TaxID=1158292 RepID=UPI0004DF289E|nr:thioredoxin family protein [Thiomonas sp. FB-Cd]
MAATADPLQRGFAAPDFALPGIDGRTWSVNELRGPKGLLVMFICNHCPYVKAVAARIKRDTDALRARGVHAVAINSNDTIAYPEDSFDNMKLFAAQHGFGFPYLFDETQGVARAFGAVCTPDFFGFNADLKLEYRGQLDASRRQTAAPDARRDLFEAMKLIAATGHGPEEQYPSIGCSIKWKEAG